MGSTEPERLPPPPFRRTRYFAFEIMTRRDYFDPIEICRIMRSPERREVLNRGSRHNEGWPVTSVGLRLRGVVG
jgi:hypothetical protein